MTTTQERLKRGTLREDGMVFWGYEKGYKNGERWVTPERFLAYKEWVVAYNARYSSAPENKARRRVNDARFFSDPKNKERVRTYAAIYRRENAERLRAYYSAPENHERLKAWRRSRQSQRIKTDAGYRLTLCLRQRVRIALKGRNKAASTVTLLGCSLEDFKKYLEARFLPGMSWENHGVKGWHIDHIIPCAAFDLTDPEQQKICFSYKNLQPLWAADNIRKSDSIPGWSS